jgi:hypothetical protein
MKREWLVRVWRGVRWLVVFEIALWRSLFRWITRRPAVAADGEPFSYGASVTPVFWVFIGLSAIEIPILHLIFPWPAVQLISLIVGAYGLFWMIGLVASFKVHPHVVEPAGLRVRSGAMTQVFVPWADIAQIRTRDRTLHTSRGLVVEEREDGLIVHVNVGSQTNVDIVFHEPVRLPLANTGGAPVTELRIAVDEPRALVARARPHLSIVDQV